MKIPRDTWTLTWDQLRSMLIDAAERGWLEGAGVTADQLDESNMAYVIDDCAQIADEIIEIAEDEEKDRANAGGAG